MDNCSRIIYIIAPELIEWKSSKMSRSLKFDKSSGVIYVTYSGEVSLEDRVKTVEEITEKYSGQKPLKIIIDVRELVMHLSFGEQKDLGQFKGLHEGLKGAAVSVVHPKDHNPNMVVDLTAFSHGLRITEFNNMREAISWIKDA